MFLTCHNVSIALNNFFRESHLFIRVEGDVVKWTYGLTILLDVATPIKGIWLAYIPD